MKFEMIPEFMKIAEDALDESRNTDSERKEYDGHRWSHCIAAKLPREFVRQHMPSESDIGESLAGMMAAAVIRASRKRPRLENGLLRLCEMKEVIPDELMELPGKKLVPRSALYAYEQELLAGKSKSDAKTQYERARYEHSLALPFLKWEQGELAKGRPREQLMQVTFWIEMGHVIYEPAE